MKQWQAIASVLEAVKSCPEVLAVFLKGSLAYGTGDEYSDVDFYCMVEGASLPSFLQKRVEMLEQYRPLVYHSESDFVGPQVVAVYNDGLHFDLYTVTPETFPTIGSFKVLWDPHNLLDQFTERIRDHSIPSSQVETHFSEFSFTLLEFHAAWMRGDVAWSTRLASHLAGDLGIILRYRYDKTNAALGTKRLESVLPVVVRNALREAIQCTGDNLPRGVEGLCGLLQTTAENLEKSEGLSFSWPLFYLMRDKVRAESRN